MLGEREGVSDAELLLLVTSEGCTVIWLVELNDSRIVTTVGVACDDGLRDCDGDMVALWEPEKEGELLAERVREGHPEGELEALDERDGDTDGVALPQNVLERDAAALTEPVRESEAADDALGEGDMVRELDGVPDDARDTAPDRDELGERLGAKEFEPLLVAMVTLAAPEKEGEELAERVREGDAE